MARFALIFSLLFLVSSSAHAEFDRPVVFTEELAPVHYTEDGEIVGIATDIVQAIFQEAGLRPDIRSYPWKRTYLNVLRTKGSFVYTINRTPRRENLFQWIGPILHKRTYLYRLASRDDVKVNSTDDLKKYTTVVILGYALTQQLEDLGLSPDRELIVTRNKKEQMRVFLKGRAELITGNEFTLARALRESGYSMDDVKPVLLMNEKGYYLAANQQADPQLVERLRLANTKVQQSGLTQRAIAKYMQGHNPGSLTGKSPVSHAPLQAGKIRHNLSI
ncbi:MAG TPA: transporter substrate-binding domain-containing protein [Desulfobulbus sp.]|nr:transporter substrate-binding domain-containing protein [Desulfobulbus sp.]